MNLLTNLFLLWNEAGVRYCHWKGNANLKNGFEGTSDLDILVSIEDKTKAEKIMQKAGLIEFRTQYTSQIPDVFDWLYFDAISGILCHVHLHYEMIAGKSGVMEYNLPFLSIAFNNRLYNNTYSLYTINPSVELIVLFTRIGLDSMGKKIQKSKSGYVLSKKTIKEIEYLKRLAEEKTVIKILNDYFGNYAAKVNKLINKEALSSSDIIFLRSVCPIIFKSCKRYGFFKTYLMSFEKKAVSNFIKIFRNKISGVVITKKTPKNGYGLVIAFLGQDGSGKSTVSEDIEKWLTWKIDAKRFYMGSGDHWNPWQKSMLHIIPNIPIFKPLRGLISLSLTMSLANEKLNVIKKAQNYKNRGGIALFDRFPQIAYKGINDGPRIRVKYMPMFGNGMIKPIVEWLANREEKKIEMACNMSPQIVFKLMLSPEESMRRKPFEKYNEVKKKHEIIKHLEFPDSDVYTIDATQQYEEELVQIKRIIWQHIPK